MLDFEINPTFGTPYIGIDWGFSVDPTAIIECYIFQDSLYIRNAASRVGLELDDTGAYLIDHVPNVLNILHGLIVRGLRLSQKLKKRYH